MANAKLCDRCKKVEPNSTVDGWSLLDIMLQDDYYIHHRDFARDLHMDLCPKCTAMILASLKQPVSLT